MAKRVETTIKKSPGDKAYWGLTELAAEAKLKRDGPNCLTEKKGLPWYVKFLLTMTGFFNYLLWTGAILCFISFGIQTDKSDKSSMYLGIVLILTIVVTGSFTYLQSSKSEALMA